MFELCDLVMSISELERGRGRTKVVQSSQNGCYTGDSTGDRTCDGTLICECLGTKRKTET